MQQLRGTRRVGTFDGAQCRLKFLLTFFVQIYEMEKASARYEVKNVACCALRFWLSADCFKLLV